MCRKDDCQKLEMKTRDVDRRSVTVSCKDEVGKRDASTESEVLENHIAILIRKLRTSAGGGHNTGGQSLSELGAIVWYPEAATPTVYDGLHDRHADQCGGQKRFFWLKVGKTQSNNGTPYVQIWLDGRKGWGE